MGQLVRDEAIARWRSIYFAHGSFIYSSLIYSQKDALLCDEKALCMIVKEALASSSG